MSFKVPIFKCLKTHKYKLVKNFKYSLAVSVQYDHNHITFLHGNYIIK